MNPQQLLAALAALQTPQAMAPVATEKPQVNGVQITGADLHGSDTQDI